MARQRDRAQVVESVAQVRALASAVRQEIVDTLQALGTASIAELATQLGRPADGLYYHVRALLRVGLVQQSGQRAGRTRAETVYCTASPRHGLRLRYQPASSRATAQLHKLVGAMLRTGAREFRAALAAEHVVVEGHRRDVWAARRKTWLNAAEQAELVALLDDLQVFLGRRRTPEGRRPFALTYLMSPCAHPRAPRSTRTPAAH